MSKIQELVRSNIENLSPYTSAREQHMDYGLTLLDANENPWGAIGMVDNHQVLNRYPDPFQRAVKEKLGEVKDILPQNIFLGNGSDEIIDLIIRIFCEPGSDEILTTTPTYGMYKVSAAINDVNIREVPLSSDFRLDGSAILQAAGTNSKIVFLCSPNNPTGNLLDRTEVIKVLEGFNGIVVIDEAYIDFSNDPGFSGLCQEYTNMLVMQTFSKAWGLAGIRLGIGFTSEDILYYLNKVKPPYNVNQLTQKQAISSLNDVHEISMLVAKVQNGREWLRQELSSLETVELVYPSDANFLLVKVRQPEATFNKLIENQIVVRDRSKVRLCEGCLRITVGTEEENQRLIDTLKRTQS